MHSTGVLTLWEEVKAGGTTVQVKGPKVQVTLFKAFASTWQRLVHQRFGWIQQDKSRLVEEMNLEEDEEIMVKKNPQLGFLAPYLCSSSDGEEMPHYHPITGETVMNEEVLLSCMKFYEYENVLIQDFRTDSSDIDEEEFEDDFPDQLVKLN